jgi:hypothetical protein
MLWRLYYLYLDLSRGQWFFISRLEATIAFVGSCFNLSSVRVTHVQY